MLGKIWKLSDHDKDGYLDDEEFALGWFLTDNKVAFQKWLLSYLIKSNTPQKDIKLPPRIHHLIVISGG